MKTEKRILAVLLLVLGIFTDCQAGDAVAVDIKTHRIFCWFSSNAETDYWTSAQSCEIARQNAATQGYREIAIESESDLTCHCVVMSGYGGDGTWNVISARKESEASARVEAYARMEKLMCRSIREELHYFSWGAHQPVH